MFRPRVWSGWGLAAVLIASLAWAGTPAEERPLSERAAAPAAGPEEVAGALAPLTGPGAGPEAEANTTAAAGQAAPSASFSENDPWQDFVVHFVVSLPFTGLYSYLTVATLDALVQGVMPPTLRQADTWVVIGLALGTSLAVALGSVGRVPDQSVTERAVSAPATGPSSAERDPVPLRWEWVRLNY